MTEQIVAEPNEAEAVRRVWWLCHAFLLGWLVLWSSGVEALAVWKSSMLLYTHAVRAVAFASAWALAVLMLSTGNRWVRYTEVGPWWILPLGLVMVSGAVSAGAALALDMRASGPLGYAGMLVLFFWLLQRFLPGGALDAHQGTNASKHLWRDALVILVIPSLLAVILLAFPKLVSKSPIVGRALLLETMPLLGICLLVWKHARAFRHPRLVVYTLVAVWLALMVVSESHKLRDSWSPAQGMITAAFGVPAGTMLLLEVGSDGELMHLMSPMIDQGEFERTMAGRRAILPFRLAWVALESSRWIAAPLPLLIILALGMATYRRRGRLAAFALSVPVVLLCLYVEGISISTAGYTNQTSINARPLPRGATVFSLLLVGVMLCLSAPRQEVVPPISPRVRRRLAWAALFLLPGLAVVLFLPAAIARRQDQALEEFRVQAGSSPGANRIRDDIYRAFAIKAGNAGVRKGWANFNTMVNSLQHARNSKTAAPGESEQVIAIWRKDFRDVTEAIAEAEASAEKAGVEPIGAKKPPGAAFWSLEAQEQYALAEAKVLVYEAEQHANAGRTADAVAALNRFWRISRLFQFIGAWEWNRTLWDSDGVVEAVLNKALESPEKATDAKSVEALTALVDAWLQFLESAQPRLSMARGLPAESKWPIRLCVEPEIWQSGGMFGISFYGTRSEFRAQGQRLRLLLIRYHLERGEFPDTLDELFEVVPHDAHDMVHPVIDMPVWVNLALTKKSADEAVLDWAPPQGSVARRNARWGMAPITVKMPPKKAAGEGTDAPKP